MSDLISRSALIKRLQEWNRDDAMDKALYNFAMQRIIDQPTIEAVPVVKAEWIKQKPNPDVMKRFHDMGIGKGMSENSIYWTCSNCGNWGTPNHKFCSNCGADMRKVGVKWQP